MVITRNVKIMKRKSSLETQIHSKGSKSMTYKASGSVKARKQ